MNQESLSVLLAVCHHLVFRRQWTRSGPALLGPAGTVKHSEKGLRRSLRMTFIICAQFEDFYNNLIGCQLNSPKKYRVLSLCIRSLLEELEA